MNTFSDGLDALSRLLGRAGYYTTRESIDIGSISSSMIDCEIIARNDEYCILYMEADSNWRGTARSVAESQNAPCLVATKYKDSVIMTTIRDRMTRSPRPRHIVISPDSEKYGLPEFVRMIRATENDDFLSIDERVQEAFDAFSKYDEAIRQFEENLDDVIRDTKEVILSRAKKNKMYIGESKKFVSICKEILNDTIQQHDITSMLIQHVITSRIFAMVYDYDFVSTNSIAQELERLRGILNIPDNLIDYSDILLVAESITSDEERQQFIRRIYETFYKKYDPKRADRDGIVYTPIEIVDFILNSVQHILQSEFDTDFSDRTVKMLDPFTGTGTFLARLLASGMLGKDITAKYKEDIFANELLLLAFYIATVNMESTYASAVGGKHIPFEGMNYTDTFMMNPRYLEDKRHRREETKIDEKFTDIRKRRKKQHRSNLRIIVGNPPYSAGQSNFNDQNQNVQYPDIDRRIEDTYRAKTKAINPKIGLIRSLYDSYIRSIRWASDRIGESGIIGFVTNGSFIRSEAAAGVRACLQEEFTDVWVFDLRGNQRTQGEISKKEGGKIFGSGSRAPVSITILVKNPTKETHSIHYCDIGDYHSREKKLEIIRTAGSIHGIKDWQTIKPDKHYDWLDQRTGEFSQYLPIGSKDAKAGKDNAVFRIYSSGVKTHRDVWVYNSSEKILSENMKMHIDYCNSQDLDRPIIDPKRVKWTLNLSKNLKQHGLQKFIKSKIRIVAYRPFFNQYCYFDPIFNEALSLIPKFFPKNHSENLVIVVPYKFTGKFSTMIANITPDLELVHHGQCFPLYTYENGTKQENITDATLKEYQEHYKKKKITKHDIFYYVYGLLHHEPYKKKYANNLSRELPHIPMAPDFWGFSKTGKKLADLHLSWETCKRYDLCKPKAKFGKYQKMAFDKIRKDGKLIQDKSVLKINGITVFDNIPETNYRVNGRTPLEWAIDRYKIHTDKESGIINDATDIDIISLIERLLYVGIESDRLVSNLPEQFEPENWEPASTGIDKFMPDSIQKYENSDLS